MVMVLDIIKSSTCLGSFDAGLIRRRRRISNIMKKLNRSGKTELHNIDETVGKVMKSEHF